VKSLLLLMKCC